MRAIALIVMAGLLTACNGVELEGIPTDATITQEVVYKCVGGFLVKPTGEFFVYPPFREQAGQAIPCEESI